MKRYTFYILLFSCIAFLGVIGCSSQPTETKTADAGVNEDARLTEAVEAKIASDQDLAAREIDVETDNGVVTLRGTVATEVEAQEAIELAKTAEGVRSVYSHLKTDTDESADAELDQKLEKETDSIGEKAENVGDKIQEGIRDAGKEGKDATITAEIKLKLAADDVVEATDIDVDTKNGRVTLNGTVASKKEEQRAVQIARSVDDVLSVRSRLTVSAEEGGF